MSRLIKNIFSSAFYCLALVAFLSTPASASSGDGSCADAEWFHLDSTVERYGETSRPSRCFETYLPSDGILMLRAGTPDPEKTRPALDFLGRAAAGSKAGETFSYLERRAHRILVEVRDAGSYRFCVTSPAAEGALGRYSLASGFVAFSDPDKDDDPKEDEPEPDPTP